jgi:tRNA (guanine-N7-)-methyltransferase
VARKEFRRFAPEEVGGEAVIGGLDRVRANYLPPDLVVPDRLVAAGLAASVDAFRAASAGRPLSVEVGPGKGRFAVALAGERPDGVVLAVDTRLGFCLRGLQRAAKAGVRNLWIAWGDARVLVPLLVPAGTAREAFLLFPDPWWKRRHAARRHGPAMATALAAALAPGGEMVLKSDVEEYLEVLRATFAADPAFEPAELSEVLPQTDREVRLLAAGAKVFAAALRRR